MVIAFYFSKILLIGRVCVLSRKENVLEETRKAVRLTVNGMFFVMIIMLQNQLVLSKGSGVTCFHSANGLFFVFRKLFLVFT